MSAFPPAKKGRARKATPVSIPLCPGQAVDCPETVKQNACGLPLTPSQEAALEQLRFFKYLTSARPSYAGVSTRPIPLICGASGTGKTALVHEFARREGLPLWHQTVSCWLIQGCRDPSPTLAALGRLLHQGPSRILFLDELEKLSETLTSSYGWYGSIQQEIYSLLDADSRLKRVGFSDQAMDTLRRCLIVGAGTWQTHRRAPTVIGFASGPTDDSAKAIQAKTGLTEELVFRFNGQWINLDPVPRHEFIARIAEIREAAGAQRLGTEELERLACEAWESRRNVRWLEQYLGELLQARFREGRTASDSSNAVSPTR